MYSPFQLTKNFIKYYLNASNGTGHGVHSPFVFNFIKFVLNDKNEYDCYTKIEQIRKNLLANNTIIEVEDFGAGSTIIKSKKRVVRDIAASSLKPKKYSRLLFRLVQHYENKNVLELGTSFGTTAAYLASANNVSLTTMEGDSNIATIAKENFSLLSLNNIKIVKGNFDITLPNLLKTNQHFDFIFLDGNHRKNPTLNYFKQLLSHSTEETIFVFDDIHWSKEMEETWQIIQQHERVTLTIDLFFIGIAFLRKDFKAKQHFVIRF